MEIRNFLTISWIRILSVKVNNEQKYLINLKTQVSTRHSLTKLDTEEEEKNIGITFLNFNKLQIKFKDISRKL